MATYAEYKTEVSGMSDAELVTEYNAVGLEQIEAMESSGMGNVMRSDQIAMKFLLVQSEMNRRGLILTYSE